MRETESRRDRRARGHHRDRGRDRPPNATVVMVIEDADRFGLSQLHQPGRVGRAGFPSTCVLMAEPITEEGEQSGRHGGRHRRLRPRRGGPEDPGRLSSVPASPVFPTCGQPTSCDADLLQRRGAKPSGSVGADATLDNNPELKDEVTASSVKTSNGCSSRECLPSAVCRLPSVGPKARLLRIIAGSAKGWRLEAPRTPDTRPITDRAKEINLLAGRPECWAAGARPLRRFGCLRARGAQPGPTAEFVERGRRLSACCGAMWIAPGWGEHLRRCASSKGTSTPTT